MHSGSIGQIDDAGRAEYVVELVCSMLNWKDRFHQAKTFEDPNRPLYPENCPHTSREPRRFQRADKRVEVRLQCLRCRDRATLITQAETKRLCLVVETLPWCEPEAWEERWEYYKKSLGVRTERWFAVYRAYQASPDWAFLRDRVLRRDGHLCQGCLQAKAVEAHRRTHAHIGDEFLFDLVAVCQRCFAKLRLPETEIPRDA